MSREILFRGLRADGRGWVYGYLVNEHHRLVITSPCVNDVGQEFYDTYEVIPETVGQFTGLTDKNGVKIFEGDIVRISNFQTSWKDGIGPTHFDWKIFNVEYNRYTWAFQNECLYMPLSDYNRDTLEPYEIELTGNIHEGGKP